MFFLYAKIKMINWFKRIILNIALTTSAFSNPLQTQDSAPQQSITMPRLRRRFADFEDIDIIQAAQISKDVYYMKDLRKKFKVRARHEDEKYATRFALIEAKDGKIHIGFRGTANSKNVLVDLWSNWAKCKKTGEYYHNGILKAYESLHNQVEGELKKIALKRSVSLKELIDEHVCFTGHSLGAGLAILAAKSFLREHNGKAKTICFAAPMVMDAISAQKLTEQLGERILNIQQKYDPVPHVMNLRMHPPGHAGYIMTIPHPDGILNVLNIHKMESYYQVILKIRRELLDFKDSSTHFNPQSYVLGGITNLSCSANRFIHDHITSSFYRAAEYFTPLKRNMQNLMTKGGYFTGTILYL